MIYSSYHLFTIYLTAIFIQHKFLQLTAASAWSPSHFFFQVFANMYSSPWTFLCYPNKITTPPSQHFLFQLQFFIALFFIWYSICFSCLFNNLLNTFLIHGIHSKSSGLCSFVATLLHRKRVQCTFVEITNEQMNRCYPYHP